MAADPATTESEAADLVERILAEGAIDLRQAAELLGPLERGRVRSYATMCGYCTRGMRGVKLEAFHGPRGWVTSAAAVKRFLARLTVVALGEVPRDVNADRAEELQRAGAAAAKDVAENLAALLRRKKESRDQ